MVIEIVIDLSEGVVIALTVFTGFVAFLIWGMRR